VVAGAALAGGRGSVTIELSNVGRPIKAVYSGDANFAGSSSPHLPAVVNAASYTMANFAPDEVATLFGITGLPGDIPATSKEADALGGVTVTLTDSEGMTRTAPLYGVFATSGQINLVVPSETAPGLATVTVSLPGGNTVVTLINIAQATPGIFTANASGQGIFAGQVLYVHKDNSQTVANSTDPVSFATSEDRVFLILYGTGVRHAGSVAVTVNGLMVPVLFFGAQGSYSGLDQINVGPLPSELAGSGPAMLVLTTDGQAANAVTSLFQ
jgi:uncharacterized protein (TIGR03437 family)